jgi:hypothetical protein
LTKNGCKFISKPQKELILVWSNPLNLTTA